VRSKSYQRTLRPLQQALGLPPPRALEVQCCGYHHLSPVPIARLAVILRPPIPAVCARMGVRELVGLPLLLADGVSI